VTINDDDVSCDKKQKGIDLLIPVSYARLGRVDSSGAAAETKKCIGNVNSRDPRAALHQQKQQQQHRSLRLSCDGIIVQRNVRVQTCTLRHGNCQRHEKNAAVYGSCVRLMGITWHGTAGLMAVAWTSRESFAVNSVTGKRELHSSSFAPASLRFGLAGTVLHFFFQSPCRDRRGVYLSSLFL
jgi:hypothetical protein